ncbi:hypothetical protein AKJ09_10383 [Labilithrix luteola]|uniref:Uncharacterized protein n=1 Tax=Labilithrix luteola TaxID=1391654 RepID=A0A0K1QE81_9BACT|nr:hypothetical protein [Labilithrix luteola]AKV03720.1 hypothetical protein AKJ09_10383 [Labilithrix luteola]
MRELITDVDGLDSLELGSGGGANQKTEHLVDRLRVDGIGPSKLAAFAILELHESAVRAGEL